MTPNGTQPTVAILCAGKAMGLWQTVDTESEAAIAKGRGQRHAKQALAAFRDARAVRTPTTQPPAVLVQLYYHSVCCELF